MEGLVAILVPLGFFAMIVALAVLPRYFQSRERQKVAEAVKVAIEKGQSLPPEMMDALTRGAGPIHPTPERDLRKGLICLGVGVGLALFGLVLGLTGDGGSYALIGIAAIPAFIGVALIAVGLMGRSKDRA